MTDKECEIETSKAIMEMRNLIEELEKEKCELLGIVQGKDKVIQELEKENAELKANKQFLNNLVREKEQRGLEIQEDLLRENEKLKEQCLLLADCNTCHSTCKNENVEIKKQFTKAKELIDELEKENAELKKQLENRNCSNCRRSKAGCPNDGSCHNFSL